MTNLKCKDIQACRICSRGVMHSGQLLFYRLTLEHHAVNVGAVQRLNGLEQMISPVLASVMGPDEDLSEQLDSPSFLLCQECVMTKKLSDIEEP